MCQFCYFQVICFSQSEETAELSEVLSKGILADGFPENPFLELLERFSHKYVCDVIHSDFIVVSFFLLVFLQHTKASLSGMQF